MAGMALEVSDVLGYKPSPDEQRGANLRALNEEKARHPNDPKAQGILDKEIADVTGTKASAGIGDQVVSELVGARTAAPRAPAAPSAPATASAQPAPADEPISPFTGKPGNVPAGPLLGKPNAGQEVGNTILSGMGHMILGGLHGLYRELAGDTPKQVAAVVRSHMEDVKQPETPAAKKVMSGLGSNLNPLNWIPNAGAWLADKVAPASPATAAAIQTGAQMVGPGAMFKVAKPIVQASAATNAAAKEAAIAVTKAGAPKPGMVSAGSAAATNSTAIKAAAEGATPELREAILTPPKGARSVNQVALDRQIEADSLPIPIRLTKGQATGDAVQLSHEFNNKGRFPQIADHYNLQGKQLHENIDALRDRAAPDAFGVDHVENGQAIIDAYKATDDALRSDISAKYKALEEANGGKFPVDGVAFADAAEKALASKLKTDFVPAPIARQLERFKKGEPMTFETFEAMRTNLAGEMRKAERSGDGNAAYASGLVRDALESIPMTGEAAALKPLADTARAAAKARFDLLAKDPAYKAAVNDSTNSADFINKFVINGKPDNVATMIQDLGEGSAAHQTMAAGLLNNLKSKAGENFSQANFNKLLDAARAGGKLRTIVGPQVAQQLETLGNVAKYTQHQPRGSFMNNSHTLVGALAEHGKGAAEGAINVAAKGIPIGTIGRKFIEGRAAKKSVHEALQTGAGIHMKDIK